MIDQHLGRVSFGGCLVSYWILDLRGAFLVWVGETAEAAATMADLHVAVPLSSPTPSMRDPVSATCVMGDFTGPGYDIAQKLSRRLRVPVYLSFNLAQADDELLLFVQKELLTRLLRVKQGSVTTAGPSDGPSDSCETDSQALSELVSELVIEPPSEPVTQNPSAVESISQ
eukprot:Selendium_serpulae@DN286_c0_g1_i1.p1